MFILIKFIFNVLSNRIGAIDERRMVAGGKKNDKQRNDRDMDIRTHPFPANQLVFMALRYYQLNEREEKPYKR